MHFSPTSLEFMLQSCVLVQGPYSLHKEKEFSLEASVQVNLISIVVIDLCCPLGCFKII